MKKYYYLYKITNILNGKIYIGVHRTDNLNDNYMGSGINLKRAIKKYGIDNFKKEIIEYFANEKDMFQREIEIVDADFILREDTYNLTEGGYGRSFSIEHQSRCGKISGKKFYENSSGMFSKEARERNYKYLVSQENLNKLFKMSIKIVESEEIRNKRKEKYKEIKHQQGNKNSQFGTMWVTNGKESKKINKKEIIPDGWHKGRVQKHRPLV